MTRDTKTEDILDGERSSMYISTMQSDASEADTETNLGICVDL
jgi:hypothetical protein